MPVAPASLGTVDQAPLHAADFLTLDVIGFNHGPDLGARHVGRADLHAAFAAHQQDLVQRNLGAGLQGLAQINAQQVAGLDPVLMAAGFNDGIHVKAPNLSEQCFSIARNG